MISEMFTVKIDSESGIAQAVSGHRRLMVQLESSGSIDAIDMETNKVVSLALSDGIAVKATTN